MRLRHMVYLAIGFATLNACGGSGSDVRTTQSDLVDEDDSGDPGGGGGGGDGDEAGGGDEGSGSTNGNSGGYCKGAPNAAAPASCSYSVSGGMILYGIDLLPPDGATCSVICHCTVTTSTTTTCGPGTTPSGAPLWCPQPSGEFSKWSRYMSKDDSRFCGDAADKQQCNAFCMNPSPPAQGAILCCSAGGKDASVPDTLITE
jgi:hypothetical protein